MKKPAFVLLAVVFAAGAVYGQEEYFKHIDFFIQNFPQSNNEAWDILASWGYIIDNNPMEFFRQYFTRDYLYEVWVWPKITENIEDSNSITFRFLFHRQESVEFYRLYREAVFYFTEKYINFNKTIENNNHTFTNGDILIYIAYNNTETLFIEVAKRRNR